MAELEMDRMIQQAWFTGLVMMPAFHEPKKFPKKPDDLIKKSRKPGERMSDEEMLDALKGLVGNYGDVKPPK